MDLIGLGDLRSEVDIVEAVDITGFYLQDEGEHSFVVVPPYCLMLMHDIAQFVAPFIPRSFLGANRQVLDPGRTLERMTRMALRTLFSSYASTKRKYESIPWLSETCIAQLPIQALSEEEISLPKLAGTNDSPRDAVALAGNKAIQDQRRQLENGKQRLQCHWYCFDLINAMLIKDNTLCYSKDKSHGADEQIRLFNKYHIFFQDKNLSSSALTAKEVQEEADKVYKSISRVPEAQAILVLIPLAVGQELQKAATKSAASYLYCAPNSRMCSYVLPDLHVVILLEESLGAFLGGSNVDILRQIREQEHVPFDQAFTVEAPYLQLQQPPSPSPSPKRVTIFDGTKSSATTATTVVAMGSSYIGEPQQQQQLSAAHTNRNIEQQQQPQHLSSSGGGFRSVMVYDFAHLEDPLGEVQFEAAFGTVAGLLETIRVDFADVFEERNADAFTLKQLRKGSLASQLAQQRMPPIRAAQMAKRAADFFVTENGVIVLEFEKKKKKKKKK